MKPHSVNVAVLASGRGSNFESLATACLGEDYPARIALLIADNAEAGALGIARRMGIETAVVNCGPKKGSMNPESSLEMTNLCKERDVKLVCLAGFMRIVKGKLLEEYAGKMLNIHPALLPSFKGLHGQKQALDYGVRYSGCTVHFVDAGIDTGPIIIQRIVPVHPTDDEDCLSTRILEQEHIAYPEAVRLYAEGKLHVEGRRVFVENHE